MDDDYTSQRIGRTLDALLLQMDLIRKSLQMLRGGPRIHPELMPIDHSSVEKMLPQNFKGFATPSVAARANEQMQSLESGTRQPTQPVEPAQPPSLETESEENITRYEGRALIPVDIQDASVARYQRGADTYGVEWQAPTQQTKDNLMSTPTPEAQPNLIHKFKNIEHRVRALLNEQQSLTARQAEITTMLSAIQGEVMAIESVLDSEGEATTFPKTTDVKTETS